MLILSGSVRNKISNKYDLTKKLISKMTDGKKLLHLARESIKTYFSNTIPNYSDLNQKQGVFVTLNKEFKRGQVNYHDNPKRT